MWDTLNIDDDIERRESEESDEMVCRKRTTISTYQKRSKCAIPKLEERRRKEGERNRIDLCEDEKHMLQVGDWLEDE
jgi:hypothetical protein